LSGCGQAGPQHGDREFTHRDVVEVSEFPDLAQRYMVRGVPKTVINDSVEFLGNVPEATFVEHIQRA